MSGFKLALLNFENRSGGIWSRRVEKYPQCPTPQASKEGPFYLRQPKSNREGRILEMD